MPELGNVTRQTSKRGLRRLRLPASLLATAGLLGAGLTMVGTEPAGAAAMRTVKIQEAPGNFFPEMTYIGEKLGFFAKHHIKPTLTTITTGVSADAALSSGSINLILIDPNSAQPLLGSTVPIELVVNGQLNEWRLMVPKSLAGLPLKQVLQKMTSVGAPSAAGAGGRLFDLMEVAYGIPIGKVQVVATESGAGVLSGAEQGIMVAPSFSCSLQAKGLVTAFSYGKGTPTAPNDLQLATKLPDIGWYALKSWVQANKSTVKDLQLAYAETQKWMDNAKHVNKEVKFMMTSPMLGTTGLTKAQMKKCVASDVGSWEPWMTANQASTWSTIIDLDGQSSSPLPPASSWIIPGLPNEGSFKFGK